MFEHPIRVKESVSVGKVSHLLLRYRISGILVVKSKDDNKLVGIFTIADILRLINDELSKGGHRIKHLKEISKLPVGKVANKKIVVLKTKDKVVKAIALMHKKDVQTIPVYEGKKLVGVVGRHDILNIALNYY